MIRSWCSRSGDWRRPIGSIGFAVIAAIALDSFAIAPLAAPQSTPTSLLDQAIQAEIGLRFNAAVDRLYQIVLEHPESAEASTARVRLARLLTLVGDLPAAILECQALRNKLPTDHPLRQPTLDLATTIARRIRAPATPAYFATLTTLLPKGVTSMDEPTHVDVNSDRETLLVDAGDGRAYLLKDEIGSLVPGVGDVSAAAMLPDRQLIVADKAGISIGGTKSTFFTGAWGGRTRPLKKTRSIAALSAGDLLVIDRDYDGLLRCQTATAACAPWGPPGKVRAVVVGASDFVFVLDDRSQSVRVLDNAGRLAATVGPASGGVRFGEIADIAVDRAYGLYMLDKQNRRVVVVSLRADRANAISVVDAGSVVVPSDGDLSLKNPSALGVMPDGTVLVAGRSTARLMRFQ